VSNRNRVCILSISASFCIIINLERISLFTADMLRFYSCIRSYVYHSKIFLGRALPSSDVTAFTVARATCYVQWKSLKSMKDWYLLIASSAHWQLCIVCFFRSRAFVAPCWVVLTVCTALPTVYGMGFSAMRWCRSFSTCSGCVCIEATVEQY
jgi:hypothetical protein